MRQLKLGCACCLNVPGHYLLTGFVFPKLYTLMFRAAFFWERSCACAFGLHFCLQQTPLLQEFLSFLKVSQLPGFCLKVCALARTMLVASDTYISMPVIVHELVEHAIPPDELGRPQPLDRRSCLFHVALPPDQLNPEVHLLLDSHFHAASHSPAI